MSRPWPRLLALYISAVAVYLCLDTALFRTRLYLQFLEPESYAGRMVARVRMMNRRTPDPRRDICVVGDSRMAEGFSAKLADQLTLDYRWFNCAQHGSSPRVWYYLLREIDPHANRFRAIAMPVEEYEDQDPEGDPANSPMDLHAVIPILRWTDTPEFAFSFPPPLRSEALRDSLFRGVAFKQDVQEFLSGPSTRLKLVRQSNQYRESAEFDYTGSPRDMTGVVVDWAHKKVTVPSEFNEAYRQMFQNFLFHDPYPHTGDIRKLRLLWFGRILERYRKSPTRMIFFRTASWPWPQKITATTSAVRDLASRYGAAVLDPAPFLAIETPANFADHLHVNAKGRYLTTRALVEGVRGVLNPAIP